ncbi:hypothetical protein SARC_10966 [Sphaeroforma arctica JP610]|uniref:Uncharacterized protein n=1 Tax=Sphaeroforma arctica JP610 TaxID=667725 RepID=A0A0L0FJ86_9EUKA|nr:hypothetical protein SARC_10966 [Sphaeroforma arctica JP610]KNC76536.1 hypothetical protein SARC_10966 [Sphaeroforma arctica JP610]|eukprot:XP_014150438.1 hypothetical protein SARC_10966 [Sphaeroforma arctica JP610]
MFGSELIYALCLVFLATVAAAFPSNVDTLVKQYGEMYLKDGIVPQVAKTHAFMKEGKVHMHVDLLGITFEFLLEPTSVFNQDLIISVVKGGGVAENDERNADVSGTAIVHDNGFNKVLMYTIGETEYTLDGFGLEFDSGYSYFYAVKDVKVDPNLTDEARTYEYYE